MATGKRSGFGVIAITIFALMWSLCGCGNNDQELRAREARQKAEEGARNYMDRVKARSACESQGGIVITDKDGNMINCAFNPK